MVKKVIKSVTKSVGHGIKNDPEVQRLKNRFPRFFKFVKKRLTSSEKYGLHLTVGILITLFFIYLFFGIVQDYFGQEALIRADLRIINLIGQLRTPNLNQSMLFITYLAKAEIIVIGVIVFSIILILLKNWRFLNALIVSVVVGEIFVWIIKNIFERPRPPLTDALVNESTYSFPSGHTFVAIALYGLLTYFVLQSEKNKLFKIISFILGIGIIISVASSRIYLGAHWPSDVLASFVVGSAWLTIIITSLKIKKKFHPIKFSPHFTKKTIFISSVFLISSWLIFIVSFYLTNPLKEKEIYSKPKTIINSDQISQTLFQQLPKIGESVTGAPAEPINIIIVSDQETLHQAFIKSDWFLLDQLSLKTVIKIIDSVAKKYSYPQTPGLPVFWDTKPNSIGYGQPIEEESTNSRHHIHLWETPFITEKNELIWVGTAHFDEEIKRKFNIILPIHTTQILVDEEREKIKEDIDNSGFLRAFEKIDLTGLTYGAKKSGNKFLSDGQAYILYLKDGQQPN